VYYQRRQQRQRRIDRRGNRAIEPRTRIGRLRRDLWEIRQVVLNQLGITFYVFSKDKKGSGESAC